jgi:hypothetical protein
MADIEVEGPDGAIVSFPEGTPSDVMSSALKSHYKDYTANKAAEAVQSFMGGDPTFAPNIGKGAMELPGAVGGYLKSRTPTSLSEVGPKLSEVGSDIYGAGKTFLKELQNEPVSTIGSLIPGISETMAVNDMSKLNDAINKLDAAGQKDKANQLRKYLPVVGASLIPGAGMYLRAGVREAEAALTPEMRTAAKAAGYSAEDIDALGPQLLKTMNEKGVSPAAATEARFSEFGVTPTLGQATGDPVKIARERASQSKKMSEFMASQPGAMKSAAEEIINAPASYTGENIQGQAAKDVISTLQARAADAKGLSDAEYKRFYGTPGSVAPEGLTNFKYRVSGDMDPDLVPDPEIHTVTSRALDLVGEKTNEIADFGRQYGELSGPGKEGEPIKGQTVYTLPIGPTQSGLPLISAPAAESTLQGLEGVRKTLNRLYPQAAKNNELPQFNALINSYDRQVEQVVNSAFFSGDPKAVEIAAAARKKWADYKKTFGIQEPGDKTGDFIEKLIAGAKNETDLRNAIFNLSSAGNTSGDSIRLYDRINNAIGKTDPDVMQGINSGLKQDLLNFSKENPDANFKDIAKRIDATLNGSARPLAERVLTPEEIGQVRRFGQVANALAQKGVAPSENSIKQALVGSGINLASTVAAYLFGGGTFLDYMASQVASKGANKLLGEGAQYLQARKATAGLPSIQPSIPAPYYGAVRPFDYQATQQAEGGRIERKAGGSVIDKAADALISDTMRNQKLLANQTERMLSMPDDAIVQALHVARSVSA